MPWRERSPMDERVQFISDYLRQLWTMTQLCHRYAISRKTAYKWVARYEREGASGLVARSSRPGSSPQATAPREVAAIVALRKQHPSWGARRSSRCCVSGIRLGRCRRSARPTTF